MGARSRGWHPCSRWGTRGGRDRVYSGDKAQAFPAVSSLETRGDALQQRLGWLYFPFLSRLGRSLGA